MEGFLHMESNFYNESSFHGQFLDQNFSFNDQPVTDFATEQAVRYREGDYSYDTNGQPQFPTCSYESLTNQNFSPNLAFQNEKAVAPDAKKDGICEQERAELVWGEEEQDDNETASRGQPLKKIRRLRANDRERRRMRSLNRALDSLKKCLPVPKSKRRVTKLEILRIACSYIRSLSDTLNEDSRSNESSAHGRKSRTRGIVGDPVVNGFSVAQRLEILSGNNANRI